MGVPDDITTDELLAATGVTRDALYEWVARRLLPRPRVTNASAAWPRETVERVRFIVTELETHTIEDVSEMVRERWPPRR